MTKPQTTHISRDFTVQQWLREHAKTHQLQPETCVPASSDASFRRYFRVQTQLGSFIVMDAPPGLEDCAAFLKVQQLFATTGLHVPQVFASDVKAGILLLEDLGDTPYLQALQTHQSEAGATDLGLAPTTARQLYQDATKALVRLQLGTRADALPLYSAELLRREMELFREWYCGKHMHLELSDEENQALDQIFTLLIVRASAQPQVYVHRDYHSRNLMVCPTHPDPQQTGQCNPGVIDFQDAVIGAITYDLVSLLRDAYIEWPEPEQIDFAVRYWEQARCANLPVHADFAEFYSDFEWMGLQRHLKVLGIFARLWHRDGKAAYLPHLPLVQKYVRTCAQRYAVFIPLLRLLDRLEKREAVIHSI